ncbi:MAG: hypothetical protein U0821_26570 [Chloroflexota bacterium]
MTLQHVLWWLLTAALLWFAVGMAREIRVRQLRAHNKGYTVADYLRYSDSCGLERERAFRLHAALARRVGQADFPVNPDNLLDWLYGVGEPWGQNLLEYTVDLFRLWGEDIEDELKSGDLQGVETVGDFIQFVARWYRTRPG